jgi:pilus assembly protein CpaC
MADRLTLALRSVRDVDPENETDGAEHLLTGGARVRHGHIIKSGQRSEVQRNERPVVRPRAKAAERSTPAMISETFSKALVRRRCRFCRADRPRRLRRRFHAAAEASGNIIKVGRATSGTERVSLGLNKSIVLDLPVDAHDILVANPEVADAVTRTARRIYLFGKKVGETNIFIFDKSGKQVVSLDLRHRARRFRARPVSRALHSRFRHQVGNHQRQHRADRHRADAAGRRQGEPACRDIRQGRRRHAGRLLLLLPARQQQIVNLLDIVGGDQVTLKVTVAEVQRTVMKQLGVNLLGNHTPSGHGITFSGISEGIAGALGKPLSNRRGARRFDRRHPARRLFPGDGGSRRDEDAGDSDADRHFRREGRVPRRRRIQHHQGLQQQRGRHVYDIETLDYGIGLEFTPVVLAPGRISLKIRTSVSEPTVEGTVPMSIGAAAAHRPTCFRFASVLPTRPSNCRPAAR